MAGQLFNILEDLTTTTFPLPANQQEFLNKETRLILNKRDAYQREAVHQLHGPVASILLQLNPYFQQHYTLEKLQNKLDRYGSTTADVLYPDETTAKGLEAAEQRMDGALELLWDGINRDELMERGIMRLTTASWLYF